MSNVLESLTLANAADEAVGKLAVALKLLHSYEYLAAAHPEEDETQGYDIAIIEEIVRGVRTLLMNAAKGDAR